MRQLTRFCRCEATIAGCTCDDASIGAPEAIGSARGARARLHKRPPAKGAGLHSNAIAICTAAEFCLAALVIASDPKNHILNRKMLPLLDAKSLRKLDRLSNISSILNAKQLRRWRRPAIRLIMRMIVM